MISARVQTPVQTLDSWFPVTSAGDIYQIWPLVEGNMDFYGPKKCDIARGLRGLYHIFEEFPKPHWIMPCHLILPRQINSRAFFDATCMQPQESL